MFCDTCVPIVPYRGCEALWCTKCSIISKYFISQNQYLCNTKIIFDFQTRIVYIWSFVLCHRKNQWMSLFLWRLWCRAWFWIYWYPRLTRKGHWSNCGFDLWWYCSLHWSWRPKMCHRGHGCRLKKQSYDFLQVQIFLICNLKLE